MKQVKNEFKIAFRLDGCKGCCRNFGRNALSKDTVKKIIDNKADYVVQLKSNNGNFHENVYVIFDKKYMDETDTDDEYEIFETIDKGHGRIERRVCYMLSGIKYFTDYISAWSGLKKIFAVRRIVTNGEKTSEEISCYLSSVNMHGL